VSYADFITLLFAFFVVLYAFAKADEKQHRQVSAAIESGFRSLSIIATSPQTTTLTPSSARSPMPRPRNGIELSAGSAVLAEIENMRRDLLSRLSPQIARKTVTVQLSPDGLVISLRETGFFDSGKAVPRPETGETLRQITQSIRGTSCDMRVEGHTDNVPIHNSTFDSNWELSSARATSIARLLLQLNAIPPQQLSAAGYAEYHPIASNSTPEGRSENRRVDLVVMPRTVLPPPPSDDPASQGKWRKITDQ
jgi:chemotaxis protein MotB